MSIRFLAVVALVCYQGARAGRDLICHVAKHAEGNGVLQVTEIMRNWPLCINFALPFTRLRGA